MRRALLCCAASIAAIAHAQGFVPTRPVELVVHSAPGGGSDVFAHEVVRMAEKEGLNKVFTDAGFEWRGAGCSMCLAMNPDKLVGDQLCASSSNRNFKGRQGSPTGRTILMSPVMVAAAAVTGEVADAREVFELA